MSKVSKFIFAGLAAGALAAQPCVAAGDPTFADAPAEQRRGAFAGVNLRVGLGDGRQPKARAGLQLAATTSAWSAGTARLETRRLPLLELGVSKTGRAQIYAFRPSGGEIEESVTAERVLLTAVLVVVVLGGLLLVAKETGAGAGLPD